MKFDKSFFKNILIVLALSTILAVYPLIAYGTDEMLLAIIAGVIISTLNIFLGYITIEYAYSKSMTGFLKWILGGIGIRMLIMLGLLLFVIKILQLHLIAFMISLFAFYAIYLVLEILYIDKKVRSKTS
jgi:hypothetical protein